MPIVVLARVARTWSLYRPLDMVRFNAGEDREGWVTRLGLIASDNPDLPLGMIQGILEAREELKQGLAQPYQWGVLQE